MTPRADTNAGETTSSSITLEDDQTPVERSFLKRRKVQTIAARSLRRAQRDARKIFENQGLTPDYIQPEEDQ